MSDKKDFKDTLLMPKTNFAMRGNLGQREKDFQKEWDEIDLYNKVLEKNATKPYFVLHDGPPYANGNIHIGHVLNKVLKDMIVRYKNMSGFKAPYIPGWDTHGLPIENALTKNKKIKRHQMSVSEFRDKCKEYALRQVLGQEEQFRRMGILADYDNKYVTLDPKFEAEQIKIFGKMAEQGLIFKGLKPVHWSWSSESALAEAEIEYQEKTSPSIYVAMKVVNTKGKIEEDAELVIWTTTPWTIPANLAIAVGEDIDYTLIKANNRKFLFATALYEDAVKAIGFEDYEVIKEYKGASLEGMSYEHPIYKRISPVVIGHHVTTDGGTGLVHIAPGHGEEDFIIGKKYGLEILCPVNDKGVMTKDAGFVEGMFYEDANKEIGMKLEELGALLKLKFIKHQYPHDWRTKKPVMFRATAQWFASIDGLKKTMLEEIKNVSWIPEWGEKRLHNMVVDRKEWCISRQRVWGVPIPVFYGEDGSEILDTDVINHVSDLFAKHGSGIWFEKEAKDLLPEGYTHKSSPNGIFTKEKDIMDVWFDSGSSHHAAMKQKGLPYPADLYLEGSDQYRGWFNSSLSTGVAMTGKAPYKQVLTHGFVNDAEGRKMSKSIGNVVDPIKVANQMGADILRLWVSSVDYQSDVRISDEMLKQVSEVYRRIRNTYRFLLGNLNDFDNNKDRIEYNKLGQVHRYVLSELETFKKTVLESYDNYTFSDIYRTVNAFISNTLSAFYLDFTKDILYIEKADNHERRSVQTVFNDVLFTLVTILNPILPHTCNEAYKEWNNKSHENVYLEDIVPVNDELIDTDLSEKWNKFNNIRSLVLKELEDARNNKVIGKSFNAHLFIEASKEDFELLNSLDSNLGQLFIVSKFDLKEGNNTKVKVEAAKGHTCARCWQVVDQVNTDELCDRCAEVIK